MAPTPYISCSTRCRLLGSASPPMFQNLPLCLVINPSVLVLTIDGSQSTSGAFSSFLGNLLIWYGVRSSCDAGTSRFVASYTALFNTHAAIYVCLCIHFPYYSSPVGSLFCRRPLCKHTSVNSLTLPTLSLRPSAHFMPF